MSESDKKYYERMERQHKKFNEALSMARKRGEAAAKWLESNELTGKTKLEFDRLMKETDNKC